MSAMDTLSWNFLHMRLCILEIIPRVLYCFSVMTIISLSDFLLLVYWKSGLSYLSSVAERRLKLDAPHLGGRRQLEEERQVLRAIH